MAQAATNNRYGKIETIKCHKLDNVVMSRPASLDDLLDLEAVFISTDPGEFTIISLCTVAYNREGALVNLIRSYVQDRNARMIISKPVRNQLNETMASIADALRCNMKVLGVLWRTGI